MRMNLKLYGFRSKSPTMQSYMCLIYICINAYIMCVCMCRYVYSVHVCVRVDIFIVYIFIYNCIFWKHVGRNSIQWLCTLGKLMETWKVQWNHRKVNREDIFCGRCIGATNVENSQDKVFHVCLGRSIDMVDDFSSLGDLSDWMKIESIIAGRNTGWSNFRELLPLLATKGRFTQNERQFI